MEKDMDGEDRVEEDDQRTHGQDDRAGKRQKIHRSGGSVQVEMASNEVKVQPEAQCFRAQQEDVGAFHFDKAAWQDLAKEQSPPATFQFADTGLAFRLKGRHCTSG